MCLLSKGLLSQNDVEWIYYKRYEEFKEMQEVMEYDRIQK